MSEPKLISPLLDGFAMGAPMSDHDGVCCCPAIRENTDDKYIVKILSIPTSQVQLEALLLTGAYKDPGAAVEYYRELADGIVKEAECLKKLSHLDGFLPFEGWQVVPMERSRLGYQVYLLSSYRRSLEKHMRRNSMTHLAAVNLGLDLCTALSAARRAGWIYADLKPSNIFISDKNEYRIGDLGLIELDSLKYASLPEKYHSGYTAPEMRDVLNTPGETVDTYAAGMILYQIFNDGVLPQATGEEPLPAPANADYEIAEIILKACAPKPGDRWADPAEMGQALVAYMQRNTVQDTPIMPPLASIMDQAEHSRNTDEMQDETLPGMNDEPVADAETLSGEMAEMIAQAEDLITHELPAPPVAPEGTSIEALEAQILEAAETGISAEADITKQAADPIPETPEVAKEESSDGPVIASTDLDSHRRKLRRKALVVPLLIGVILALLGGAGFWFYQNYYLLTIDELKVVGVENHMTVILDTDVDNSLLTVICTDTYGNTTSSPVVDGQAAFTDLQPDMGYKIRVEVEGFHKLDGSTTHEYMTPAETQIASFTVATGPQDGSVILNFTVDGPDSDEWIVMYAAEGEEALQSTFTGHMVTINGLTVGKTYTFQLKPVVDLYVTGEESIEFTAARIIIAEDLQLSLDEENNMTVTWATPEDAEVGSWTVRCYSNNGYEQTVTTSELTATFEGITLGSAYTVEITAEGMTQPARTGLTANPLDVTSVSVKKKDAMTLEVSWEFTGPAPEGGWLLMYTIDGGEQSQVVQCGGSSGIIEVLVPGATYELTIQAADGSTVFHNTHSYTAPNADGYANKFQAFYPLHHQMYINLLKTPENPNWNNSTVGNKDFTTTFTSGDKISMLIYYAHDFYVKHEDITIMYVIRNSEGKVLSEHIGRENVDWRDLWWGGDYHFAEFDIPSVPTEPGEYTLYLYFDGGAITKVSFTITE